jgi:hypothetical protein
MKQTYKIVSNKSGEKFVVTSKGIVPADIAGLGAGKDAWLRNIECQCVDCNQLFPLSQMQGNGRWCEECGAAGLDD